MHGFIVRIFSHTNTLIALMKSIYKSFDELCVVQDVLMDNIDYDANLESVSEQIFQGDGRDGEKVYST